jgi:hypothetical protein
VNIDWRKNMADHKFVYTISGVDLSDGQKAAISEAIGAAVATAMLGAAPKAARSDFLNILNTHGGRRINADAVADERVGEFVAASNRMTS